MSPAVERRRFLAGLGALAIFPLAAASARVPVLPGDFILQRVLVRGLSGGAQIVVTRRWSIAFRLAGNNDLRVIGTQIDADVDAPPALQALARIEAARDESGFFPIVLNEAGRIVSQTDGLPLAPLPEEVVDEALAYAKAQSGETNSQGAPRAFLSDLSKHADRWLSALPGDLFFPEPRDRSISHEIALPDGASGTIEIRESVSVAPASGLMTRFERTAVTRAQSLTREGSEIWTLTPTVS